MPNGPEFIESLFGIVFTGEVAVPVNARFTARELGHVVRDAGLRVLLASDAAGEPRSRADVIAEASSPNKCRPMSSTKVQTFRLREQLEAELAAARQAGQVPR